MFRKDKLLHEVEPGTFAFNSPYQVGFGLYGEPQGNIENMIEEEELVLERGDIIVVGTDGLFDNVFVNDIGDFIKARSADFQTALSAKEEPVPVLASIAKALAKKAFKLAKDDDYVSPFAKEAIKAGKAPSNYSGGYG